MSSQLRIRKGRGPQTCPSAKAPRRPGSATLIPWPRRLLPPPCPSLVPLQALPPYVGWLRFLVAERFAFCNRRSKRIQFFLRRRLFERGAAGGRAADGLGACNIQRECAPTLALPRGTRGGENAKITAELKNVRARRRIDGRRSRNAGAAAGGYQGCKLVEHR